MHSDIVTNHVLQNIISNPMQVSHIGAELLDVFLFTSQSPRYQIQPNIEI